MLGSFTSVVRPCTFSKAIAPLIRSKPVAQLQQIRFATKKAAGSSNNNRDSAGRRLGIKVWPGTQAKPGAIIIRQRGKKFYAGENVGMGKDHTIFSKINGEVYFTRNHKKSNVVHVRASA